MPRSRDPLVNPFIHFSPKADAPALDAMLVSPSDAADLPVYAKALRIYNPGAASAVLRVTYAAQETDATTVDLTVPPGLTVEPSAVRRVWTTGTGAGLVVHAYIR